MKILICGADGFVGRHLVQHLRQAGHQVIRGVRRPREAGDIAIDYARDHSATDWLPRLDGIDVVINAIGILIETPAQPFAAIHAAAPIALFDACAARGGIKVIQVSALGVEQGTTGYFRSKLAADQHLTATTNDYAIVRPSLVYGTDGGSSQVFRLQASLPVIGLPGDGTQALQPIHIDDLCACVQRLIESAHPLRKVYELAGTEILSYRALIACYRRAMGLGNACFVPVPMALMRITARLAEYLPQRVLSRDTLSMLAGGNTAPHNAAPALLGHAPKLPAQFIPPEMATPLRSAAVQQWSTPLLQLALALMWFAGGVFSLLQADISMQLLAMLGLGGSTAQCVLYAASGLDLLLGVLTLVRPSRCLWLAQIALVAAYTAIISAWMPSFWLHPFGPVVKNLPILALLLMLYANTPRRS